MFGQYESRFKLFSIKLNRHGQREEFMQVGIPNNAGGEKSPRNNFYKIDKKVGCELRKRKIYLS